MELRTILDNMGKPGPPSQGTSQDNIRVYQEEMRPNIGTFQPGTQIYNKLPTFCGNQTAKDMHQNLNSVEDLNAFLRAIDEHIELLKITDEKSKINILKLQLEKQRGDSRYLMNLVPINCTYEKLKDVLRKTYGVSNNQTLGNTAINIHGKIKNGINFEPGHIVEEVYKLCDDVQTITEAFIKGENMQGTKLEPNHLISHNGGDSISVRELLNAAFIHLIISPMLNETTYKKN